MSLPIQKSAGHAEVCIIGKLYDIMITIQGAVQTAKEMCAISLLVTMQDSHASARISLLASVCVAYGLQQHQFITKGNLHVRTRMYA